MEDNFDLKKFIVENKSMERSNPYLAKGLKEEEDKDILKAKIREMVKTALNKDEDLSEAKSDEEEEVEDTEEVDVVDDGDMPEDGFEDEAPAVEGDEAELMDHLEAAIEVARGLGDEELVTQLGNTITFFTRQHIAK